jgi:hypothetical protein
MSKFRRKIAFGVLITAITCFVTFTFLLLGNQPYFTYFKSSESVKAHVLKSIQVNETSLQDVQTLIDNQVFGQLDCVTQQTPKRISCVTLKEQFSWWYYQLDYSFENDVLTKFEVYETYRGL